MSANNLRTKHFKHLHHMRIKYSTLCHIKSSTLPFSCNINLCHTTCRLVSRIQGPTAPRHLGRKQQALCALTLVPPSSPEVLNVKRRESPLLVKGGIMGEKWPIKFSLTITTSTEIVRDF
jgi:hypothetical protein